MEFEAYLYRTVRLQPTDYLGETPLRLGRYSYVLSYEEGELSLRLMVAH